MRLGRRATAVATMAAAALVGLAAPGRAVVPIEPGARITLVDLEGERQAIGSCSIGWVLDGKGEHSGDVFFATGAHCVTDVGAEVALLETGERFGAVAVIGSSASSATDWALIRVYPGFHDRVRAAMKNHPEHPTGSTVPGATDAGDRIRQTDLGAPRESILVGDTDEEYVISGPVVPFDSGGPVAHIPTGRALGLVSRGHDCQLPSLLCATYSGPTVQGVLAKAADAGFPTALRTV